LPGQAKWVPLLDTNMMARRQGKEESYWPVAVAQGKFHCIILKGGAKHPYFPRPLLSEFDFSVPYTPNMSDNPSSATSLEERFLRESVLLSLREDTAAATQTTAESRIETSRKELSIDKILLQLVQIACREDRNAQALDLASLLRRTTSVDAAIKIATHHNQNTLAEKMHLLRDDV